MSRKTPLSSQTTKLFIVIRKNVSISMNLIKQYCDMTFTRYAFIEHKDHVKVDTGEIEGIHYHIVGDSKKTKTPLSTQLNAIVKFFKFDDAIGIEIEQYESFEGALQYLTHKNNPEKTQVDKSQIVHNLSKADFEIFYNATVGNVITFELLYSTCLANDSIIGVIQEIGLNNFRQWRNVVWDIFNGLHNQERKVKLK